MLCVLCVMCSHGQWRAPCEDGMMMMMMMYKYNVLSSCPPSPHRLAVWEQRVCEASLRKPERGHLASSIWMRLTRSEGRGAVEMRGSVGVERRSRR